MGFQMAGSWGGYGFSAIFCVLCIILTNPFSWSFLEVLPRGVFKDILISPLKNFLELSKLQKCLILNFVLCFYNVFLIWSNCVLDQKRHFFHYFQFSLPNVFDTFLPIASKLLGRFEKFKNYFVSLIMRYKNCFICIVVTITVLA